MEEHDCPMKNCNKKVKCKCFEIDFDEGLVYFCSPKCIKECADEGRIDIEDYEGHDFKCEQYGKFNQEWVKRLQEQFIKNEDWHLEREIYWHRRVEALCPHKSKSKDKTLCFGCLKEFPKQDASEVDSA